MSDKKVNRELSENIKGKYVPRPGLRVGKYILKDVGEVDFRNLSDAQVQRLVEHKHLVPDPKNKPAPAADAGKGK